ncbi:MAG: NTP transferase domain-containing protein, partial [Burkholderiaceae bacterium]|nr:NTP transferase domain-containing protein [Burkholderiaceae bacterium]
MNIVILAAGQGKRMRSALPKVLHPLAGRPMLAHVLALARAVRAQAGGDGRIVVVIGHGAQAVRSAFKHEADVQFVLQEPQLGTGHAVQQAVPWLDEATPTLVLYGDVPLLRAQTVMRLLQAACAAGRAGVGLLTARLEEPHGYGRIVRDEAGHVRRIVEERDASAEERLITEVNTGILVAPTPALKRWLACLSADNAQGEYYLTDVVTRAVAEGAPVAAVL